TGAGGSDGGGAGGAGGAGGGAVVARPWDWAGVVGTGQSLAVGQMGSPAVTTTQPYHNLKLSTGTLPWPIDPGDAALVMATLIETQAITRLASAMGKTYGVGAIIVTHGESDSGNPTYESDLYQLWSDYQADLPAITGQTQKIQMIVSQQNSVTDRAASTLA